MSTIPSNTTLRRSDDEFVVRDFAGSPGTIDDSGAAILLRLLHITDMHLIDAGSPARCDWVESMADDSRWHPLLHMCRPYDTLVNWGLASFVRGFASNGGEFVDLVIATGDNIDNAQRNELDAYLALLDGGSFAFHYDGPQRAEWATDVRTQPLLMRDGTLWPFWVPDGLAGSNFDDLWRATMEFPTIPGLLDETANTIDSPGLGVDWLSVLGNHDVMRQGTVYSTDELETIATGDWRSATGPDGFSSDDPLDAYLRDPARFSAGTVRFPIASNGGRRAISRTEFIRAHRMRAYHRGFSSDTCGDYVHDTEHVRVVVLDTNHPFGHYQGSVGSQQLAWLDDVLSEADRAKRPVLLASHHGGASLDNTFGTSAESPYCGLDPDERLHAAELEAILLRHECVIAWLVGHRHVNHVRAVGDPDSRRGFWEITTSSLIDYPNEARIVEVLALSNGELAIRTTMASSSDNDMRADDLGTRLAATHRSLAARQLGVVDGTPLPKVAARRRGKPTDRNVVLLRPH